MFLITQNQYGVEKLFKSKLNKTIFIKYKMFDEQTYSNNLISKTSLLCKFYLKRRSL